MRESQTLVDDDDFDADVTVHTPRDHSRPAESQPFQQANYDATTDLINNHHSGIVLEVRKSINAYQENDHFSKSRLQETPPRRLEGTNKMGKGESQSTNKKVVQTK